MKCFTIEAINQKINGKLKGNPAILITGVDQVADAKENQLTFIGEKKYIKLWQQSSASAAIVNDVLNIEPGPDRALIRVADADLAVVLMSTSALRDGLGDGPERVRAAQVRVLPVLWGRGMLPDRFPVHRKHVMGARVASDLVKLLTDERKRFGRKIIESKKDLFGYGLFLSLLHRA